MRWDGRVNSIGVGSCFNWQITTTKSKNLNLYSNIIFNLQHFIIFFCCFIYFIIKVIYLGELFDDSFCELKTHLVVLNTCNEIILHYFIILTVFSKLLAMHSHRTWPTVLHHVVYAMWFNFTTTLINGRVALRALYCP